MGRNKLIIVILLIIFIIGGIGFLVYNQNHFSINGCSFKIPEGYHVDDYGKYVNVTNGDISVSFMKNNTDKNVNESISKYVKSKKKGFNATVDIATFTIDGIKVYKSNVENNTQFVHYWYEDNGKVYELFSWSGNKDTDFVVSDLIKYRNTF